MKRILSLFLSFVLLISITSALNLTAYADETSGVWGDNATWQYDISTKTLSINGTGIVGDWREDYGPWSDFNKDIETVIIGEGITNFNTCYFSDCNSLKNLYIPVSINSISERYYNNMSLISVDNLYYSGTIDEWVKVKFPVFEEDDAITSHPHPELFFKHLYINGEKATNIEINTNINRYAFCGCEDIENITIGNQVENISDEAFINCSNMKKAIYKGNLKNAISINFFHALMWCNELYIEGNSCNYKNKVVLDDSVTEIPSYCFSSGAEYVIIPKSVKYIGYSALPAEKYYQGTESDWSQINFGWYYDEGYSDCSNNGANLYINNAPLSTAKITNVERINAGAFKGCKSIISVTTDLSLKEVGEEAFANCANLTTITIPSNVKLYTESGYQNSLYQNSFPSSSIKVINILPGSTEISNSFSTLVRSSSVTEMEIPNSITYIPDSAFKDMTSLTSITIPKSVTRIEYNAFSGCTNLTIEGYKNSYAENYATMLGIPFEALDGGSEEHTHNYSTKTTATTTSENGSIVVSCDICGDELYKQIIYRPTKYKLSATSYTYDGKAKKPSVTVTDSNGDVISANNYTVTYSNNKSVGKATVKITFKGNYSGTVNKTFTINPKPTKITSLKAKSKGFKLKWSKVTAQADGYQIQYSTSRNFKSVKTVTVKGHKNITKTISKLKGKKKYYVRVRSYKKVGNVNYYSTWCKAKVVKTNK